MPYINIKQKKDLINVKKTLAKKTKEEKLENIAFDSNLEKTYKPLIKPLEKIVKETSETKKSIEGIKNLSAILPSEEKEEKQNVLPIEYKLPSILRLGPIASKYISKVFNSKEFDNIYGLKYDPEKMTFKLGTKEVEIEGNNIHTDEHEFQLNENVWKLLTMKNVGKLNDYSKSEQDVYADMIMSTKAFLKDDGRLHASPNMKKYNDVIKPIYNHYQKYQINREVEKIKETKREQERRRSESESSPSGSETDSGPSGSESDSGASGSGLIIIPSDINDLVKRHQLLMSAYHAGNTGVYNEIQAINDRLLSKGILDESDIINFSRFLSL